jgi:protein tyrosine phosphatase (PTP) superfamily phosphohydrolase (DUF442 family)
MTRPLLGLGLILLSLTGAWTWLRAADDPSPPPLELQPLPSPVLEQVIRVTPRFYSGGEPKTAAAFAALKTLGITTIVSVDGATPRVDLAKEYGLTYVHLPMGYDGVPETVQRSLVRVANEVPGPIYVHCHHGKHRGPAALAILCRAAGVADAKQAESILRTAGTGKQYAGLWRDVAAFEQPPADAELPKLVSQSEVPPLAAAMAELDRASDRIAAVAHAGWKGAPDSVEADATIVVEGLRESLRLSGEQYDARYREWLADALASGERFLVAVKQPGESREVLWCELGKHCSRCHTAYRDQ